MNWFNSEYERTTSKDDIVKLADVFQNYCNSDFYVNLTKKKNELTTKINLLKKYLPIYHLESFIKNVLKLKKQIQLCVTF